MHDHFNHEAFTRFKYIDDLPVSVSWDELKGAVAILINTPAPGASPFHLYIPGQDNHPVFSTLKRPMGAFHPENGVLVHNPVLWLACDNGKHLSLEWDATHKTGLCRILSYASEFKDVFGCDILDGIEDDAACQVAVKLLANWAREACPAGQFLPAHTDALGEALYLASPSRIRRGGTYPFADLPAPQGIVHKFRDSVTLEEAYLKMQPLGSEMALLKGFILNMTRLHSQGERPFKLTMPAHGEMRDGIEILSNTGCALTLKSTSPGDIRLQARFSGGAELVEFFDIGKDLQAEEMIVERILNWGRTEWPMSDEVGREIFFERCLDMADKFLEKALANPQPGLPMPDRKP